MKICKEDRLLVRCFLMREAKYYRFQTSASTMEFINRMTEGINEGLDKLPEAGNFIHIESLTNLGQMQACLTLSASKYKHAVSARCLLPPSPKGSVTVYEEEHGI